MATISNASSFLNTLGVGSGLDTSAMVDALVNAERAPRESQINAKIEQSNATVSGLGVLSSALDGLREALETIDQSSDFSKHAYVDAQTTSFLAEAGNSPIEGDYSITVQQLASRQVSTLFKGFDGNGDAAGYDSMSESINGGSAFTIDIILGGQAKQVQINAGEDTPQGIIDAINAADLGIAARSVDTGADSQNLQIVLTGEEGLNSAFSVTTNLLASGTMRSAQDAILTVDGIQLTRSTNTISDAVPGVNLELFNTQAVPVTVGVTRDTGPVKSAIQNFVEAYNSFRDVTSALGDRGGLQDDGTGSLAGNTALRAITNQLRRYLTDASSGASDTVRVLSDIGLEFDLTGKLGINETKLDSRLETDFDDVAAFFSANIADQKRSSETARGMAGDLIAYIENQQSAGGLILSQQDLLESKVVDYQVQLEDLERRMEAVRARYISQFTAMEQAVEQFNSLRESLTTQFENMPFTNKNN